MKWHWKRKKKPEPFEELFQAIREMCKVGHEYCATVDKMIVKRKN